MGSNDDLERKKLALEEWKENPVTQAFLRELHRARVACEAQIVNSVMSGEPVGAAVPGACQAYLVLERLVSTGDFDLGGV